MSQTRQTKRHSIKDITDILNSITGSSPADNDGILPSTNLCDILRENAVTPFASKSEYPLLNKRQRLPWNRSSFGSLADLQSLIDDFADADEDGMSKIDSTNTPSISWDEWISSTLTQTPRLRAYSCSSQGEYDLFLEQSQEEAKLGAPVAASVDYHVAYSTEERATGGMVCHPLLETSLNYYSACPISFMKVYHMHLMRLLEFMKRTEETRKAISNNKTKLQGGKRNRGIDDLQQTANE